MTTRSLPSGSRRTSGWFANRPVLVKIATGVVIVAAVAVAVGLTGLSKLATVGTSAETIYTQNLQAIAALGRTEHDQSEDKVDMNQFVLAADLPEKQVTRLQNIKDDDAAVDADWAAYLKVAGNGGGRQKQIDAFTTAIADFRNLRDTGELVVGKAGISAAYHAVHSKVADASDASAAALDALLKIETDAAAGNLAAAKATESSARLTLIVLLAVGLAVGLSVAFGVAKMITRPLGRVRDSLARLAEGDLTQETGVSQRDEVGRMAESLDAARESLREVLSSVVASADAVAASSEELSASSAQISASAEETAAQSGVVSSAAEEVSRSVQTVAAGAEEMGASIREIASNATQASEVATKAVEAAASTSATVAKLGESSAEIGNVVKVITSIAEQTNLLALNATIEAARG